MAGAPRRTWGSSPSWTDGLSTATYMQLKGLEQKDKQLPGAKGKLFR